MDIGVVILCDGNTNTVVEKGGIAVGVDIPAHLVDWVRSAGLEVRQGSETADGRTMLWTARGESRTYIAERPDGWFEISTSERLGPEVVNFLASSMTAVEAYLLRWAGRSNRPNNLASLTYPAATIQPGWSTAPVTINGIRRGLYDAHGRLIAASGASQATTPPADDGSLGELSVILAAGADIARRAYLHPDGAPLFTVRSARSREPEVVPDFTADVDLAGAVELYQRALAQGGPDCAREALAKEYGPALALLIRRKVQDVIAGAPVPRQTPGARGPRSGAPTGERTDYDVSDLVEAIIADPEANDAEWDRFVLFLYYQQRVRSASGFQYHGEAWTPALVDTAFDPIERRLAQIRDDMARTDGCRWNAAVITVDKRARKGALHVFYDEDAEFWQMSPANQKAIALRGLELVQQL